MRVGEWGCSLLKCFPPCWTLAIFLLVACASAPPVVTPSLDETGIPVAAEFAPFYEANGGARIFGAPITEGFRLETDGPLIQYFQAMRLDYDETTQTVTIFPLGAWALAGLAEIVPAAVTGGGQFRSFTETNLTVQDEFLSFYETFRGETLLGLPLSPQLDQEGLRVQYFENGRLEWRPELPLGQRIQVSYLGQAHFDAEMAFRYSQNQLARPVPLAGISQVDVFTAVRAAVLYAGDEQLLYVTVLAPGGRPVPDAPVDVTVSYDNTSMVIDLGRTDATGRIAASLAALDAPPGRQVMLSTAVYAANGETIGGSVITFKTWW